MVRIGDKIKVDLDGYEVTAVVVEKRAKAIPVEFRDPDSLFKFKRGDHVKVIGPSVGGFDDSIGFIGEVVGMIADMYEVVVAGKGCVFQESTLQKVEPFYEWYS